MYFDQEARALPARLSRPQGILPPSGSRSIDSTHLPVAVVYIRKRAFGTCTRTYLQLHSQSAITPAYQACLDIVHTQSQEVLSSSVLLAKSFHKHWLTSANGRRLRRPGRCNLQR